MATRGKVVVVDDDPIALWLARDRLMAAGFEVITRDEAIGTSQFIINEQPDVVLLDLKMPALSGEHLAGILKRKAQARNIAIIFHSGQDLASLQKKAAKVGALGAIRKTEDDALFISQFERLLKRRG